MPRVHPVWELPLRQGFLLRWSSLEWGMGTGDGRSTVPSLRTGVDIEDVRSLMSWDGAEAREVCCEVQVEEWLGQEEEQQQYIPRRSDCLRGTCKGPRPCIHNFSLPSLPIYILSSLPNLFVQNAR
jgi:hypothetical protein